MPGWYVLRQPPRRPGDRHGYRRDGEVRAGAARIQHGFLAAPQVDLDVAVGELPPVRLAAAAQPDGERAGDAGTHDARRAGLARDPDPLRGTGFAHRADEERALGAEVVDGHVGPGRPYRREDPD